MALRVETTQEYESGLNSMSNSFEIIRDVILLACRLNRAVPASSSAASMAESISPIFDLLVGFLLVQCMTREYHGHINRFTTKKEGLYCALQLCSGEVGHDTCENKEAQRPRKARRVGLF